MSRFIHIWNKTFPSFPEQPALFRVSPGRWVKIGRKISFTPEIWPVFLK